MPSGINRNYRVYRPTTQNRDSFVEETGIESPRVCRRLHFLRGWSYEYKDKDIPRKSGSVQYAWCLNIKVNMNPNGAAMCSISSKIGCTAETLRKWVRRSETDQGKRSGMTSSDRERLKELERENRELKRANEILRKASAFFAQAELDRRPKY